MGSYLGLKLETVSRALSRLRRDNMIALAGRTIEIKDAQRLQQLLGDYEKRRRPRDAE